MIRRSIARLAVTVVPIVALVACSGRSPIAPGGATDRLESAVLLSQPVPGQYDLEFLWSGTALTIVAHVRDSTGAAPGGGTVTIQYCSYNGYPTNDITQPDEAPSSACEVDHSGHWRTLTRAPLDPSGDFTLPFGTVRVVTVIGFRLVYSSQGSGVQSYTVVEDWYRPL
jgi:hypothetical protein